MAQGGRWDPTCGSVVEATPVYVMIDQKVASSVVNRTTSCKSCLRTNKVVAIQVIDLNIHQLLHQIVMHLQDPLTVLVEGKTVSIESLAAKCKRTLQMLSWA